MNKLWAPWRIEYILSPKTDECFLCAACSRSDDRERLVLKRGRTCVVVINRYPYSSGHLMVAPYRHVDTLLKMTEEELLEMALLTNRCMEALQERMKPDGFNIGVNLGTVAGAGLRDHVHQHIVPRWNGDTNFMPVIGDTRVMPQALDAVWEVLHDRLR